MRRVGDESPLTVEDARTTCAIVLNAEVKWRSSGGPPIGGRPGDPFGHLGDGALQPVQRAQHPPAKGPTDHRGQHEQAEDSRPPPTASP